MYAGTNAGPEFVPQVVACLSSSETVDAGLLVLSELVGVYRYKSSEKRGPLNMVIERVFPVLLEIANGMVGRTEAEAGRVMHLIAKVYYGCMQYELSEVCVD